MPYDTESQDETSPQSPDLSTVTTGLLPRAPPKATKRGWSESRYGRLCAALGLVCFTLLGTSYLVVTLRDKRSHVQLEPWQQTPWSEDFTDNSRFLNSRGPMPRFRDNLKSSPDDKFITAWPSSGWTNDVMAAGTLIYMAILTGRTPVVPPFTPSHVGSIQDVGPIAFGEVFDVPRLASELRMHILEWDELKNPAVASSPNTSSEVEPLGCWSAWSLNHIGGSNPRVSPAMGWYNLDVSFTPVPDEFSLSHGFVKNQYVASLWSLVSLAFPKTRDWAWTFRKPLATLTQAGEALKPDDQMLCFDLVFYVGLANEEEWFADYAPYWRFVARYMHWEPKLFDLAESYLRRHFSVAEGQPIPSFISIHVRRADFAGWCPPGANKEACFAPTSAYAKRVKEIQEALRGRPSGGIDARAVLVTSDERSPEWWKEIAELGPEWGWVDHTAERTVEKYGKWYPVILDAVFQSMGVGFVGTEHSTMSSIAQRRVETWNGGLGALVHWGTPHADDH
ncbi:hypothetical protein FS749_014066 [Ceratobasidium sp. UAMH 11750]|nr:hypothetical protein FS749_014066 [Ceratobasidium sp. UAMH 11750]